MRRVLALLALAVLLTIGGNANAWYLCAPTTPPAWPAVGWCQWQQSHNGTPVPIVQDCGANPGWGFVYFYSGDSFTGSCSAVPVGAPVNGVYTINADYNFVELNGWWAYANGVTTSIHSLKLGPHGGASGAWMDLLLSSYATADPSQTDHYCRFHNGGSTVLLVPSLANACLASPTVNSFLLTGQF